jgi:DNA sulfur modification protein DndD
MITFESISLQDFALYPEVTLTFASGSENALTVIRGENESGKTTLMRAFLWCLFGEEALPAIPDVRHPIRPVWAAEGAPARTRVEIRFQARTDRGSNSYKLSRSAVTVDHGGRIGYEQERVSLLLRDGDDWIEQADAKMRILTRRFFRPEMQDFYFIDADKAVEFVGGPEGRHDQQLMRRTTSAAVRALLGLDVLLKTASRLEDRATEWRRQVGRQSASAAQRELAEQLEDRKLTLTKTREDLALLRSDLESAEDAYELASRGFEADLSNLEALEGLTSEYEAVDQQFSELRSRQAQAINTLVDLLHDRRLYAVLMLPALVRTISVLDPLKESGHIPASEITLLPRLLERGVCLCGAPLAVGTDGRDHMLQHLESSGETRSNALFLDAVLEGSRRLGNAALGQGDMAWGQDVRELLADLAGVDADVEDLALRRDALKDEREQRAGSVTVLREKQKHRDSLAQTRQALQKRTEDAAVSERTLAAEVRSLSERIRSATKAEFRTQAASAAAQAAEDAKVVLDAAYAVIERDQVLDVSRSMNAIFKDVISATEDSLFGEVGIRRAENVAGLSYEPFALEGGRDKPLALANGASRRAIAVAFVLALAEQTGTRVPFVADSLLHAMSGSVRRKLVDYLSSGERVGQPILFGTRADLLDPEVVQMVKERAGQSYTLTSQTHAGGDVARAVPTARHRQQVVVCSCQVDEFCAACERVGDSGRALIGPVDSKVMA